MLKLINDEVHFNHERIHVVVKKGLVVSQIEDNSVEISGLDLHNMEHDEVKLYFDFNKMTVSLYELFGRPLCNYEGQYIDTIYYQHHLFTELLTSEQVSEIKQQLSL